MLLLWIAPALCNGVRATSMLLEINGEQHLAGSDVNPVSEEEIVFPSVTPTRARIYHPFGIAHPSPLVVVHGMHNLGIDEPRLRRFARGLAGHGYLVLTPNVDELAGYSITRNSAVVIGDAVHELARRSGAPKVGLLGLSFSGGMALIAACDPAVAQQLSVVAAVGAHDDLRRVLDFFASGKTHAPDGSLFQIPAHEYGPLVVAYANISAYFSPSDVAQARTALRALLWEDLPKARSEAAKLSPRGQARMAQLFDHDIQSLTADTQRGLAALQAELDAASPHSYLSKLTVPVMLLHGASDNVVPPTETLWLERDLPPGVLQRALISPAIGHVELGGATTMDRLRLIQWMSQMLELLDASSAERG
jgi:pimeloyl-ACP methyl ester carboxylesterase